MGKRPRWAFGCPRPYQTFVPTAGRPRPIVHGIDADGALVEMARNRGRKWKREGDYSLSMSPRSPIEWGDPAPLQIGEARAEYVAWHFALSSLARDLAGKLVMFEPSAPSAPALPWIDGEAPASRIVGRRDLSACDVDQALTPRRGRPAGKPIESPIEAESVASYNRASRKQVRRSAAI
jgi:hypothetical protein